jgi:hypothetical protein
MTGALRSDEETTQSTESDLSEFLNAGKNKACIYEV